jgi:hypothetical protein
VGVVSIAAVAHGEGDVEQVSPGEGIATIDTIQQDAKEAMSVLKQPRSPSDSMPAATAERFRERGAFGMNPALSRRTTGDTTHSVFVVPARDHVCLSLTVGQGANMTCAETSDVTAGKVGAATVTLEGGAIGIYGMVPDGVRSVALATGKTDMTTIATVDNTYFTAVPEATPLRTISFVGPSGAVEYPIYDPALAFEDR